MRTIFTASFLLFVTLAAAQDNLLDELDKMTTETSDYTQQTFKGSRVVNGHSVETRPAGSLEFIISHRFGRLNEGSYNLWGLDFATIRLGLEYGITDRLGIAVGRSSFDKTFDSYVKYKVLRQQTGSHEFPFTLTLMGTVAYKNYKQGDDAMLSTNERMSYSFQALMARKFSPAFSLQVAPVFVHRNAVDQELFTNDLVALGLGGRLKITRSTSLVAEYYPRLNEKEGNPNHNAIGFGFDIETGGHVFSLVLTNSQGMTERLMVAETTGDFFDGDIHFGFNITRTFQLRKDKQKTTY